MDISDRIKPTDSGITTFLENLRNKKYQIPTFQREVVWEKDHVKKLWDSIYRFYPVGSILVWKTPLRLQKHREVGGHLVTDERPQDEYQYILDGQQRTTSLLTSLFGGRIEGREGFDPTVYVDLKVESGDEPEDESYKDRFLFWSDIDDEGRVPHRNNERKRRFDEGYVVRLHDVAFDFGKVERKLVAAGHDDYDDPVRERLRQMKQVLDNYRVAFIELKGIQVAEVCQIFERINQAGKPLGIFDIVVAKTFEPVQRGSMGDGAPATLEVGEGFYLRDIIEEFRTSIPDSAYRNVDELTLLQAAAAVVREEVPGTNVKNVTDRYLNELTTEELKVVWPETAQALRKTFDLFENHLKLKGPALIPNRYLYLAFAVYFYENSTPDYELAKQFFWYLSFHNERLLRSTSMLWPQIAFLKARKRGEDVELGTFTIDREVLRTVSYSSRSRYSRAVLALFANQDPRDWRHPDTRVLKDVYYQLTDQPNLHHVFPLAFTEKMEDAEWVDRNSLMNIAYLTQITNLKVSAQNPVDYVQELPAFSGMTETRQQVAASHLLPEELFAWSAAGKLPSDALRRFIEARVDLVLDDLKAKVGADRANIVDTRFTPAA